MNETKQHQDGIKPSKKYANGSIHEMGRGRFQILDRYLNTSGEIMLKIQWLKDGQVEDRPEKNVSAAQWKWEKTNGYINATNDREPIPVVTPQENRELLVENSAKLEDIFEFLKQASVERRENLEFMQKMHLHIMEQKTIIEDLVATIKHNQERIDALVKQHDIVNKLIEKL